MSTKSSTLHKAIDNLIIAACEVGGPSVIESKLKMCSSILFIYVVRSLTMYLCLIATVILQLVSMHTGATEFICLPSAVLYVYVYSRRRKAIKETHVARRLYPRLLELKQRHVIDIFV